LVFFYDLLIYYILIGLYNNTPQQISITMYKRFLQIFKVYIYIIQTVRQYGTFLSTGVSARNEVKIQRFLVSVKLKGISQD